MKINPKTLVDILNNIVSGIISTIVNKLQKTTIDTIEASTSLTRPANTNAYTVNDLICGADVFITGNVTNSSFVITSLSSGDIAKCKLGMRIVGTGIPTDSYITFIGVSSIIFNNITSTAATITNTGVTITGTPVLLTFDLSILNSDFTNSGKFIIDEIYIGDKSNAASNGNTQMNLIFFDSIPFPTTAADNTQLDLAATELDKIATEFDEIMKPQNYKTTSRIKYSGISKKLKAATGTKLIYAIPQVTFYNPTTNSNILTFTIKGVRVN